MSELRLRKCRLHEDCQLQRLDGGPWEHTPASVRLKERVPVITPEDYRKLEKRLRGAEYDLRQLNEVVAGLVHDLDKERGERIQDSAKVQRQLGAVGARA